MAESLTAMVGPHGDEDRELAKHVVPAVMMLLRDHDCDCGSCADCNLHLDLWKLTQRKPISCASCMGKGHWAPDCQRDGQA